MSNLNLTQRPEWHTVQSRVTIFYSGNSVMDSISDWWRNTFTEPLLRDETRNLEGTRVIGGLVNNRQWTTSFSQSRIDCILQPKNATPQPGAVWQMQPASGSYSQIIHDMTDPVRKLLDQVSNINRLAVGSTLLTPGPSLHETYTVLASYLPGILLDQVDAPDFTFRINRRRTSTKSPTLIINRLATWSIVQGQSVEIAASSGGQTSQSNAVQYAANLELDINTAPVAPRSIPRDRSRALLDELIELAIEITDKGDVP